MRSASMSGPRSSAGRWAACTLWNGPSASPSGSQRVGILSAPPVNTADQIALNSVQLEAIHIDPRFQGGEYYDSGDGDGPHRGLALARRMALLNYRSPRPSSTSASSGPGSPGVSPLGHGGRFAVASYLDFHGNSFTRRFDANSYITLVEAMNSHDVGRDRGGVEDALAPRHRDDARAGDRQRPPVPGRRAAPHRPQHPNDARRRGRGPLERLRPRRVPHRDAARSARTCGACWTHPPAEISSVRV